tara:strand:+ start:136 stop:426 length:291 start_codon:yes stop_codon:yes gene_type:complete
MTLSTGAVHLSHENVNDASWTGVILSVGELRGLVQSVVFWAKHASTGLGTQEIVGAETEGGIEKELVVSDSAWQVFLFVDFVVVDAEIEVMDHILG